MQVKLEKFEGPLGLLLRIIEKEELDITQISLSKIADEYLSYIRQPNNNIDPEEMAEFLVVAAKLLLIKSKALLPYLYPEEVEEIEEFEEQLRMYQDFADAAKKIGAMIGKKKFMFPREFNRKSVLAHVKSFTPPKNITAGLLGEAFASLLVRLQPVQKLEEGVLEKKINIEEKILHIEQLILEKIKVNFSRILASATSKTEVIVSFLALLELVKQRTVLVTQDGLFTDIEINRYEASVGAPEMVIDEE